MDTKQSKTQFEPKTFSLSSDRDLVKIREHGRSLAAEIGFNESDQTVISTAISEVCRNVIEHANSGEVTIETGKEEQACITITVSDNGPGIENVNRALQEGYSSGMGLGIGLPGAKRIMDEFEIQTSPDEGTKIKMCKWLNNQNNEFE